MQEIEDFVAEVERNTARATERAHAWKSARIVEAIEGGLGRVVVDGYGVLPTSSVSVLPSSTR